MIPDIHIEDYNYPLPDERIARYPLAERDSSKLLVYDAQGAIADSVFRNLPDYLPAGSLMIFNDTKVVPARLHFRRKSGAHIEIFCLEPVSPVEYNTAFAATDHCIWKCVIGNSKRWKDDILIFDAPTDSELASFRLSARLISKDGQTGIVDLSWSGGYPFSRILELCGQVPIPPYLNRDTEAIDVERYQTLYAKYRGSVAAPTAGLHFTGSVLEKIRSNSIEIKNVCLHVGAGTFLPVKTSSVAEHPMHREPISVSRDVLESILAAKSQGRPVIAVGTTSVRTLESLFYIGVSIIEKGEPEDVCQWAPYEREYSCSLEESLNAILTYLERTGKNEIVAGTRIIIVPGFSFRVVDMLVTNFHQPESTLILLVSAFVDGDWRSIYNHALSSGYRFLSYGDSSLLSKRSV